MYPWALMPRELDEVLVTVLSLRDLPTRISTLGIKCTEEIQEAGVAEAEAKGIGAVEGEGTRYMMIVTGTAAALRMGAGEDGTCGMSATHRQGLWTIIGH